MKSLGLVSQNKLPLRYACNRCGFRLEARHSVNKLLSVDLTLAFRNHLRPILQAMDRYFMTVPDKWTGFAMSNSVPNFDGVDLDQPSR